MKYANIFNEKSKVKKKEEKIYNNKKIKTYIFESGNKIEIYDDGRIKNYININELETFKAFEKNEFNLDIGPILISALLALASEATYLSLYNAINTSALK